jgi:hypothetical protein
MTRVSRVLERRLEVGVGSRAGHDLLVAARRRVTAADPPEAGDADRECERPRTNGVELGGCELLPHPGSLASFLLEHDSVRVPPQDLGTLSESEYEVERFGGEGAGHDVTEHDDLLRRRETRIGEHCGEGMDVAVDVG